MLIEWKGLFYDDHVPNEYTALYRLLHGKNGFVFHRLYDNDNVRELKAKGYGMN